MAFPKDGGTTTLGSLQTSTISQVDGSRIVIGGPGLTLGVSAANMPTPQTIQSFNFGVQLYIESNVSVSTAYLDAIEVAFYYTGGGYRSRDRGFGRTR